MTNKLILCPILFSFLILNGCMIHSDSWQGASVMNQQEANLTDCRFKMDNPFFSNYECYLRESNHELCKLPLKHS